MLVWLKLDGLAPPMAMLAIDTGTLLVLFSVRFQALLVVAWTWLPKLMAAVESVTTGSAPVPLKVAVWGEPDASSATNKAAEKLPAAVGVNVTLKVQEA